MATPSYLGSPDDAAQAALNPGDSGNDFSAVPPDSYTRQAEAQANAQPTPAPTPQYPPSPDQPGGQNPIEGTSEAPSTAGKPSLFRSLVMGALSGIASHVKGAGEGALLGGIPGAIAGAANPRMAQEDFDAARQIQRNRVQQSTYQAKTAQEQLAINQTHLLELQREYSMLPANQQEVFDRNHETELRSQYNTLMNTGNATEVQNFGDWQDQNAWNAFQTLHSKYIQFGAASPLNYVPAVNDGGDLVMLKVNNPSLPLNQDQEIVTNQKTPNGDPVTIKVPAGTPWATYQSMVLQAQLDDIKSQRKINESTATGQTAKNQGAANKSNAQAEHAGDNAASGEWRPKVSADEKKKAELAENIAFNANEVSRILLKRPDLVGTIAGRVTNVQQAMGNNDADISAIATHIHNMAMANSGVHGFRSQEGVESYEKQVLNNFKNGPRAVAGALRASVGSVQTFIDNARPDSYKTHSKQGGASRGMMGGGQ